MATTMTRNRTHDHHHGLAPGQKPHESPWVVTLPLVLLAIPSVIIGAIAIEPMLFGDFFKHGLQGRDLRRRKPSGDGRAGGRVPRLGAMAIHSLTTPVLWLASPAWCCRGSST
jgi:NADH-quinone oxidoreductase subunit L